MAGVCPYLTQNWVKTTQHFLECRRLPSYNIGSNSHTHK